MQWDRHVCVLGSTHVERGEYLDALDAFAYSSTESRGLRAYIHRGHLGYRVISCLDGRRDRFHAERDVVGRNVVSRCPSVHHSATTDAKDTATKSQWTSQ